MRGCVGQHPLTFGYPTDLLLALLRGQPGPVNVGLEAFEFLIPPGLILSPFPLYERFESLLRGESGPRVIFRQIVGENAGEYAQQGVESSAEFSIRRQERKRVRERTQTERAKRASAPTSGVQSNPWPENFRVRDSCRLFAGRL